MAVLGVAYLVRALADGVTDSSPLHALQWVSPLEWAALARPYAGERWRVLALPCCATGVLSALAFRLESGATTGRAAGSRSVLVRLARAVSASGWPAAAPGSVVVDYGRSLVFSVAIGC